jgi:DNA-binding response OmpR family regulator
VSAERVLVVEDDPEIRDSLVEALADSGYETFGAINGQDALRKLKEMDPLPALIVLDLMMPVMDGRSFREEQLKEPRLARIPVIVISAYRDVADNIRELNAAGYLKKPLRVSQLLDQIERTLPPKGPGPPPSAAEA